MGGSTAVNVMNNTNGRVDQHVKDSGCTESSNSSNSNAEGGTTTTMKRYEQDLHHDDQDYEAYEEGLLNDIEEVSYNDVNHRLTSSDDGWGTTSNTTFGSDDDIESNDALMMLMKGSDKSFTKAQGDEGLGHGGPNLNDSDDQQSMGSAATTNTGSGGDASGGDPNSSSSGSAKMLLAQMMDVQRLTTRSRILGLAICLVGVVASSIFIVVGIRNAQTESIEDFTTRADELSLVVETTWNDYQRTAASTHEICRRGRHRSDGGNANPVTRDEFREFYEYTKYGGDGLDFQAIQCSPNVTHEERASYETSSKAYYEQRLSDQNYNYTGFTGLIWDWDAMSVVGVDKPSPPKPFYFPINYIEPVEGNEGAIDLDLYSDPVAGAALLEKAVDTHSPILTGRVKTVQETDANAYSVIIYHPGVPLSTDPQDFKPDMISILLVRIPSLLERVSRLQEENLGLYLFDNRPDGTKEFLGAAVYNVNKFSGSTDTIIQDEIDYESFCNTYTGDHDSRRGLDLLNKNRFYEHTVDIASGSWSIVVIPVDDTYEPEIALVLFGGIMLFVASVGVAYWMYSNNMRRVIEIYQAKVQAEAERSIVANLFPENVRERLLEGTEAKNLAFKQQTRSYGGARAPATRGSNSKRSSSVAQLDSIMGNKNGKKDKEPYDHLTSEGLFGSKPIADFHPETTLLFADLKGFTAWSSVREPSQVFTLLEVLYNAFDKIANKRKIFKVETVGDCYVAASGLPIPNKNHAVTMSLFATDCLKAMPLLVSQLETTLGPDTGDLKIRIGIHSGSVTSGVLRGDKGRFQLFGDTINTASRMESTGQAGNIQVSPETAALLRQAAKNKKSPFILEPREVKVFVKGKGHLQTYWLSKKDSNADAKSVASASISGSELLTNIQKGDPFKTKTTRLVRWNTEEMTKLLKQAMAARLTRQQRQRSGATATRLSSSSSNGYGDGDMVLIPKTIPLEEVKDVVSLPVDLATADGTSSNDMIQSSGAGNTTIVSAIKRSTSVIKPESVQLDDDVVTELTDFVSQIAANYKKNPFHCFEHASHVAMAVTKLLKRIEQVSKNKQKKKQKNEEQQNDNCCFGITSDPLLPLAAFFSAMIHDVDHQGIPNSSLATEQPDMAQLYNNKSIAEQNSIDVAWDLLMRDEYTQLRKCMFGGGGSNSTSGCDGVTDTCHNEALLHFRQLVVQMVMATDVMDKELGLLRKERWQVAFNNDNNDINEGDAGNSSSSSNTIANKGDAHAVARNRKATIVLEHLIQAADVSHTMQHWYIYSKWNERLFMEMYHAYKLGRLDEDPSDGWFESELGFMDYYIIPLAKKLETCGVFGVSSDEFLIYATENRNEWKLKGKQIVQDYVAKYNNHQLH